MRMSYINQWLYAPKELLGLVVILPFFHYIISIEAVGGCRIPVIPADSGGIKFGRDISQIYNSGCCKFRWNYFIPELAPECSPEFTGTECNWNPVPRVFIN